MPDPRNTSQTALASHQSRTRRFLRGLELGLPIFLGYVPVGMAFGVLATQAGFSAVEALICSATALAGAGQLISVSMLGGGATAATTIAATAVVNLRYLLFGTTTAPHLKGVSLPKQAWLAFTLTDETFAVNSADRAEGRATVASMAGVGAIAWTGWVLGTGLGALGADWIGDPSRWGVDFAMPAMFAALFVALAENRRHVAAGLAASVLVVGLIALSALGLALDRNWFVVIASVVAAALASVVWRDE